MTSKNKSALYIHIPFCIKKCKYCDFVSCNHYKLQDKYFKALYGEIKHHAENWKDNIFDTIYIGGGTPSSVNANYIAEIINTAENELNLDLKEVSIEANPGTVDKYKLEIYKECGINRISFGMQAMQDNILLAIGRLHSFREVQESIKLAQYAGFDNINIDLMTGLPHQSRDDLIQSIAAANVMGVNHISM